MKPLIGICLLLLAVPALDAGRDPNDPTTWTPFRIRGQQKAPEFADIDGWLNSDRLTMAQLKGKVVVVHFMAFG
jgi:hypothetical protein